MQTIQGSSQPLGRLLTPSRYSGEELPGKRGIYCPIRFLREPGKTRYPLPHGIFGGDSETRYLLANVIFLQEQLPGKRDIYCPLRYSGKTGKRGIYCSMRFSREPGKRGIYGPIRCSGKTGKRGIYCFRRFLGSQGNNVFIRQPGTRIMCSYLNCGKRGVGFYCHMRYEKP